LENETDFVRGKASARGLHMLLTHGHDLDCLSYPTRLRKGCPAKNAFGAENPSEAAEHDQAEKWVESKLIENSNNWITNRKSS